MSNGERDRLRRAVSKEGWCGGVREGVTGREI